MTSHPAGLFFAQLQSSDWVAPVSGAAVVTLLSGLTKWLMNTITQELKAITSTMNAHTRQLERALDLNSRATLLMAIAQDESTSAMKAKLREALDELNRKEAIYKAQDSAAIH